MTRWHDDVTWQIDMTSWHDRVKVVVEEMWINMCNWTEKAKTLGEIEMKVGAVGCMETVLVLGWGSVG